MIRRRAVEGMGNAPALPDVVAKAIEILLIFALAWHASTVVGENVGSEAVRTRRRA